MAGRTRWWLGVAATAVAVLAAGCAAGADGGPDVAAEATTSTTTSTVPAPPAPTVEDEVLAAYQGYWDTWLAANDPPDPDHPDLERYATGAALEKVRQAITGHAETGQVIRLPEESRYAHAPAIESMGEAQAVVADCSLDDGVVLAYGSDFVLDDSVATWRFRVTMVRTDAWRVSEVQVVDRIDGVLSCDA